MFLSQQKGGLAGSWECFSRCLWTEYRLVLLNGQFWTKPSLTNARQAQSSAR